MTPRKGRGSGSLFRKTYKRADGTVYTEPTWTMQFYVDGVRKREATGLTDRGQAQTLLNKRLYQVAVAQYQPKAKPLRVEELYSSLVAHYKNDGREETAKRLEWQWRDHLGPVFQYVVAAQLTTAQIVAYISKRREEGAAAATVNRELAALRRMFNLGRRSTPPRVTTVPYIPFLQENNTRKGFVEDDDYRKLAEHAGELWLRTFLELGYTYGWRKGELLGLRVRQVNLITGKIRLEPGTTKNKEGREVAMTPAVRLLLAQCVAGKKADDYVLTREGRRISDMRDAWTKLVTAAALPGLLRHDLRRSAARALRGAGVPESVVMVMGGWRTAAMFRRYAIVSSADQRQAVEALEKRRAENSPANSPAEVNSPTQEAQKPQ